MEKTEKQKIIDRVSSPKAIIYYPDDTSELVYPKNGKKFTLEELQEFVGGWIEMAEMRDGRYMILNEEGKLIGLPYNQRATFIYQEHMYKGDFIVGTAVVSDPEFMLDEKEGEEDEPED